MIVAEFKGRWILVRQPDHGLQVGMMGAHWAGNDFADLGPRRPRIVEAGARHDDGWVPIDTWPRIDTESGEPLQFVRSSRLDHTAAYTRGIDQASESDPYVGLLDSMHGVGIYNNRYGTWKVPEQNFSADDRAIISKFISEQEAVQEALLSKVSMPETRPEKNPNLWRDYLLLQVWDRLSLQFLWRLSADDDIGPIPLRDDGFGILECRNQGDFALSLKPFPFDSSPCTFPVTCRMIRKERYQSQEEFALAFFETPVEVLECKAVAP